MVLVGTGFCTAIGAAVVARSGTIDPAIDRHKTLRTNIRQWERDGSCFDHLSPCLLQFYCWLLRRIRQQPHGYASGGIFTTAEADFTTTESTRKRVPCGPGERSRQNHMGQELPPTCIRPAIRFIANTPRATRAGVVSSGVVHAIPSKKAMTSYRGLARSPSIYGRPRVARDECRGSNARSDGSSGSTWRMTIQSSL